MKTRVTNIDTTGKRVRLKMGDQEIETDFAVIAAGARNALLPGDATPGTRDLEMTLGYFTPCQSDTIRVKFLPPFRRLHLVLPAHRSSIGGHLRKHGQAHQPRVARPPRPIHAATQGHSTEDANFYSHVLPSPQMPTLQDRPIAGDNWAMVGDAGALVDPITGEGLYYALRSGELLADALIAECPAAYPARVRADFSGDLEFATRIARYLYCGKFLGGSVTTRMIQFIDRSSAFRTLMADLFSGAQDYGSLKRRIWAQFGMTMSEVVASLFRPGTSLERVPASDINSPT